MMDAPVSLRGRRDIVDVFRALSLLGMVGYHLIWDLAYFGFVDRYVPFVPLMRVYSHSVASAFLALVGVSLALAHRDGPRFRAFFWRLAKIVAAAALVTVGSLIFAPEFAIRFGILHCIAAASFFAAPLLRAPIGVAFVAGWAAIVAPQFIHSADLNTPALLWLGLGTQEPSTLDWRPLLPWAGVAWVGFDLARLALPKIETNNLWLWQAKSAPARGVAFLGRHSLAFYLIHQLVLLGLLFWVSWLCCRS
jgi:uncharacterized membrane protein